MVGSIYVENLKETTKQLIALVMNLGHRIEDQYMNINYTFIY